MAGRMRKPGATNRDSDGSRGAWKRLIIGPCCISSLSILHFVLRRKTLGENSFFSDTEAFFFFNNAGTAQPLVCAVTAIKPMAAAELHSLWLESPPKPARMGGASGYIMWAFAKAPQISSPSATTTRSLLFETRSLRR